MGVADHAAIDIARLTDKNAMCPGSGVRATSIIADTNFEDWFKNWKHRKPDEHIWHFNDETLTRHVLRNGYSTLHYSNAEDCLRGEKLGYASYLTAVFRKG